MTWTWEVVVKVLLRVEETVEPGMAVGVDPSTGGLVPHVPGVTAMFGVAGERLPATWQVSCLKQDGVWMLVRAAGKC